MAKRFATAIVEANRAATLTDISILPAMVIKNVNRIVAVLESTNEYETETESAKGCTTTMESSNRSVTAMENSNGSKTAMKSLNGSATVTERVQKVFFFFFARSVRLIAPDFIST